MPGEKEGPKQPLKSALKQLGIPKDAKGERHVRFNDNLENIAPLSTQSSLSSQSSQESVSKEGPSSYQESTVFQVQAEVPRPGASASFNQPAGPEIKGDGISAPLDPARRRGRPVSTNTPAAERPGDNEEMPERKSLTAERDAKRERRQKLEEANQAHQREPNDDPLASNASGWGASAQSKLLGSKPSERGSDDSLAGKEKGPSTKRKSPHA